VWRIKDKDVIAVEPENLGVFFGDSSYVVKYHYSNKRGGEGVVIYYWQGKTSSTNDKAASAMEAVRLDNELNGSAVQVRIVQGNEPRHFLKIFKGKFITYFDDDSSRNTRLFRVRGTCAEDVRADQLPEVTLSLASDDSFVLQTPETVYVWQGSGASKFEKDMALSVASWMSADAEPNVIVEDSEPEAFWEALGGKSDYDKEIDLPGAPVLEPRLFHCRILRNGKIRLEEVHNFEQSDLDVDDIMILDGGDEIYLWEGQGATDEEKEKSLDMANLYIQSDPSERSEDTVPIVKVRQSHEPRSFKRLYPNWEDNFWESLPSYEDIKKQIHEQNNLI